MASPRGHTTSEPRDSEATEAEPPSARRPLGLELDIVIESDTWPAAEVLELLVAGAAGAIAANPDLAGVLATGAEACVAFTHDAEVQRLNSLYRGKDKPTNVLSFAAGPSSAAPGRTAEPRFLGDVVLAGETVAAEAAEQGIPFENHIQHLVVHGVLHLLGFDHETEAQASRMEMLERLILASLGIADPYSQND